MDLISPLPLSFIRHIFLVADDPGVFHPPLRHTEDCRLLASIARRHMH